MLCIKYMNKKLLLIIDYEFVNRMLKNLSFKCHVNDIKYNLRSNLYLK
ncbi:hypothetical protein CLOSBL3_11676 [Clostridiaceae bacterium BL-3]|nr:hypothetical protein CLOSBL3_11676 [Clostridiaceae bacterium BL-3]